MKVRIVSKSMVALATLLATMIGVAEASDLAPFQTFYDTNYVVGSYGGMRGIGTGNISLTGIPGGSSITDSYLFWHGPSNDTSPTANANVTFNGTAVTGAPLGLSSDNCWGFACSAGYRANVTSLVTGNGNYSLSNFYKPGPPAVDINGVSNVTFYKDAGSTNKRDVVVFDGNDSNINNPYDASGWNITLSGINYKGGPASLGLIVSDGQTFDDDALILNGKTLVPTGPIFQGASVPGGPGGPSNGLLWDYVTFDITSYLTPGFNSLTLTTGVAGDCLSAVVAMIDLPAGDAPVSTPEPSTFLLLGAGILGAGMLRKRSKK
jgi:hypothetical protein